MLDEGGHIGTEEILTITDPDNQWRVSAGRQDLIGMIGMQGKQSEGAVQATHSLCECLEKVGLPFELGCDQVGGNLGVGFARKFRAGRQQFGLELCKVFDDSVVNQGQPMGCAAQVRVGIAIGWCTMSGPAGVGDADMRLGDGHLTEQGLELPELARFLATLQQPRVGNHRDSGRVIAAVFEPLQTSHQDRFGRFRAQIADDATHDF